MINFDDIVNVSVEDGEIRYDLGDVRDDVGVAVGAAAWGIDGFVSMPNLPTDFECARAMHFTDGNEKLVLATKDDRYASKVGDLEPGDRAIVSAGNQRFLMKQGNESVTLYTERADGQPMMVTVSGEDEVVSLVNGGNFIEVSKDGITIGVSKGGWIRIDSDGVQLGGKTFAANTFGGILGIVPPGATSVTNGVASTVAGALVCPSWLIQNAS